MVCRNALLIKACVLGLVAFGVLINAQRATAQTVSNNFARIAVDIAEFDFGKVTEGELVQHEFVVRNDGQAPLEIKRVAPACGCTVAEIPMSTIQPGASANLLVSFDTKGFFGEKVKPVLIYTNDPANPSFEVSLKGEVERDVRIEPPRLYFGVVSKGKSSSKYIDVETDPDSGINVMEVLSRSELIQIQEETVGSEAGRKRYRVSISPELPVGVFRNRLLVKTSSERNPAISVPVFARVEGDLMLAPLDVSFGLIAAPLQEPVRKTAILKNKGARAVKIVSIESDNDTVQAKTKALVEGREFEIEISALPEDLGSFKAILTIETDHEDEAQKRLTLPVYGIVSKKGL